MLSAQLEKPGLVATRARVLIVDDSARSCSPLGVMLETAGWTRINVANPRDALELVGQQEFDLIITDLDTSELYGLVFLSGLLHTSWLGKPKILMCSADIPPNARANLARLHVSALHKPIDPGAFLKTIVDLMEPI